MRGRVRKRARERERRIERRKRRWKTRHRNWMRTKLLMCEVVSKVADTYVVKGAAHASQGKLKKN